MLNKGGVLEIAWKILDAWFLKLHNCDNLGSFIFFKKKNTFDTHVYLCYFLVLD